jgi:hypothetical protein
VYPHPPQSLLLVCTSTQAPLQKVGVAPGHATHTPAEHSGVAPWHDSTGVVVTRSGPHFTIVVESLQTSSPGFAPLQAAATGWQVPALLPACVSQS